MTDMQIIDIEYDVEIVHEYELTAEEREDFDYMDWNAMEAGTDSASFFRYGGSVYSTADFSPDFGISAGTGLPENLREWSAYLSESAWSAVVIRWQDESCETVTIGHVVYS